MELFIVHDGGQREHYNSEGLFAHLSALRPGQVINDAAAQTIAAWWHSPDSPLSTVLSTMGKVDRRMTRADFCDDTHYARMISEGQGIDPIESAEARDNVRALDALSAYITTKIATAQSSVRPCACDDCPDLVVGIIGDLCSECEEAGCTFGEGDSCQRDDAYGGCEGGPGPCPDGCTCTD